MSFHSVTKIVAGPAEGDALRTTDDAARIELERDAFAAKPDMTALPPRFVFRLLRTRSRAIHAAWRSTNRRPPAIEAPRGTVRRSVSASTTRNTYRRAIR